MIQLVYNNTKPQDGFAIPNDLLPILNGKQSCYPHHFRSKVGDNLIELAGRVCYESTKTEKSRSSEAYHAHINEVGHHSTHEHLNLTIGVRFPADYVTEAMMCAADRPGVTFEEYRSTRWGLRITLNARSLRDWKRYTKSWAGTNFSNCFYNYALTEFNKVAPFAVKDLPYDLEFEGRNKLHPDILFDLLEPTLPNEKFYTFLISNVSRGMTHELVRHRHGCAISQRSTRYVDESENNWSWHPHIKQYVFGQDNDQAKSLTLGLENLQHTATSCYDNIVTFLTSALQKNGLDAFSARKQARGAARGALGNALSTELIWTANGRAIEEIYKQRASPHADQEIREFAEQLYAIYTNEQI